MGSVGVGFCGLNACVIHKVFDYNMLRIQSKSMGARRTGFSLAELVISIGILILMMALAGQVFSITIKSTGQATALTEVTQQLRVLEETLREDLRNVQPGQSVMLIQGNPVNAYWTQLNKEADDDGNPSTGYGHIRDLEREKLDANGNPVIDVITKNEMLVEPRADILMFFTSRKATSVVNPQVTARAQQVVYGHADLGNYRPRQAAPGEYEMFPDMAADLTQRTLPVESNGGSTYPSLTRVAPNPAQAWHLARRSVLLIPTSISTESSWETIKVPPQNGGLGSSILVDGKSDYVSDFRYDDLVIRPYDAINNWDSKEPWFLPAVFGDTLNNPPAAWHRPYARSMLDPTPPMMMASRMGAFFLPNCASFKVEWSLDPRSPFVAGRLDRTNEVFWIDPGHTGDDINNVGDDDPLYSLRARVKELEDDGNTCTNDKHPKYRLCLELSSLLCEQISHGDLVPPYSLADRFVGRTCDAIDKDPSDPAQGKWDQLGPNGRPNIATFTALRHGALGDLVPDDMWPGALRITVDLYDREFRLERPIRHVMVIPIGG